MASSDHDFKQFDVVSTAGSGAAAIDNYFYKGPTTRPSPALHKKIMQEWRILKKHLPDSIFVRVYENHIEFLRAAIIGADGTPYHDALFFFDLSFPSDYPNSPPNVHFRSHGLRLNPNLYASGKVCLSLLNTWSGKRCERWNPNESTVLQVLVSIQALVLNAKPYFNEPGTGVFGNWDKSSRVYSENAFVLTCKTTAFLLRNQPGYFEDFVVDHFRRRAPRILSACRAYAAGHVRVGGYYDGVEEEYGSLKKKGNVSRKFRLLLEGVYKMTVEEFKKNGISVEGFGDVLPPVEVKKTTTSTLTRGDRNNNNKEIVKKFVEVMKKVLGLKKKKNKIINNNGGLITWKNGENQVS